MRALSRLLLTFPIWLCVVIITPILAIILGLMTAYDKLELWAVYDGNAAAREKDRWRKS